MSTLADIRTAADSGTRIVTCVDDDTPTGHFLATAKVMGGVVTYLLDGTEGDDYAPIIGRIEYPPVSAIESGRHAVAYRGTGIKGGTLLPHLRDSRDTFARIANA